MELHTITPNWDAPKSVRALTTTRQGGVSRAPYNTLNLGDHVGDDPAAVAENRRRLREAVPLPAEPRWLQQVHGIGCCDAADVQQGSEADALFTTREGVVCAVLTADCLPVLLCDEAGSRVAAVHAGWRGLLAGVIENSVRSLGGGCDLLAWLGPAIGPDAFEVGPEVYHAFSQYRAEAERAFKPAAEGKWLADIYALARQRLAECGVKRIYGGDFCTFGDRDRFYSYRRDGQTGRFASLIWLEQEA